MIVVSLSPRHGASSACRCWLRPRRPTGAMVVNIHSFLTPVPDGDEWSASRPGRFASEERIPVPAAELGWVYLVSSSIWKPGFPAHSLVNGWRIFLRARTQILYNFLRNPFPCPWEFWRTNKVLWPPIIIIYFIIIIINAYYIYNYSCIIHL